MKLLLFTCLALSVLAIKKEEWKKCDNKLLKKRYKQCLKEGFKISICSGDPTTRPETTWQKTCARLERRFYKNCGSCEPPEITLALPIPPTFSPVLPTDMLPPTDILPPRFIGTPLPPSFSGALQPPRVLYTACGKGLKQEYTTTISGLTCQKWSEQAPHSHSFTHENYPNMGLGDHNYCRNPDSDAGGVWCYTTFAPVIWDYCTINQHDDIDEPPKCYDGLQTDYCGYKQTTVSGEICQKWSSQYPHEHDRKPENFPYSGLGDHNYCRNPDNEPNGAWCYTVNVNQRWDICGVQRCTSNDRYCFDGKQEHYRGPKQTTVYGLVCQRWTDQYPHAHLRTPQNFPYAGLGNHNYCRNPDGDPNGIWCITTDPVTVWDYCHVPRCTLP